MTRADGAVQRVRAALAGHGLALDVEEFASSTRTAVDAARAVGCPPRSSSS